MTGDAFNEFDDALNKSKELKQKIKDLDAWHNKKKRMLEDLYKYRLMSAKSISQDQLAPDYEAIKRADEQLIKSKDKMILKERELAKAQAIAGKAFLSSSMSVVKTVVSLASWVGIAYTAVSLVYQLGKGFGWWGKEVKNVTKEIGKNYNEIDSLMSKISSIDVSKPISSQEFEELNKEIGEFNKKYGTSIDLLDESKSLSEQANKAREDSILLMNKERVIQLENARNQLFIQSIGKRYSKEQQANLDKQLKAYDDEINRIKELTKANLELANKEPDISALAKYYEKFKFDDSTYYDWRVKMNEKELEDFVSMLEEKGFKAKEISRMRVNYEKWLTDELTKEYNDWLESFSKKASNLDFGIDISGFSIANEVFNEFRKKVKEQEGIIANYYESVKFMDDEYYNYRKQQIEEEYQANIDRGILSLEQANILKQQKLDSLNDELMQSKELYQSFYGFINGLNIDFLNGFKGISSSIKNIWKSLINDLINQLIKSALLTLLANIFAPAGAGFKGVGLFGDIFGGLFGAKGFAPSPVGSGISGGDIVIPSANLRGDNNIIVDKLNEVIVTINNTSIRNKIRTIDRVELAQEVEAGNLQRSVR